MLEKKREKSGESIKKQINKSVLCRAQCITRGERIKLCLRIPQPERRRMLMFQGKEKHSLATEVGIVGMGLSIKGTGQVDNII